MDPTPFFHGVLAGYGIAIPVGAISILILENGLQRGFRFGFAAGAGAATADLLYALLAALAGAALAQSLSPFAGSLRLLSGWVLVGIGLRGLWRARRAAAATGVQEAGAPWGVYVQFLGLTLLNPLTVAYFAALILGQGAGPLADAPARLAFVMGAGLASFSWQTFLAGLGAWARRGLPPAAQGAASVLGNLIVIGLGLRLLF
jgi:threonine/homoserine/homoserine lactone efflux protein